MSARIPDLEERARRQERAELAIALVEQTRRMIEMAESAEKPEIVARLRTILKEAELIAASLAAGAAN